MCGTPPLRAAASVVRRHRRQRQARKKLSNPISDLVSVDAINRRDVRMIEGREDTRFALEARQALDVS
jgi:hypothetical protein